MNRYFSVAPRTSLFQAHSIPEQLWAVPLGLTPRDGFHELATHALFDKRLRRAPYPRIELSPQLSLQVTSLSADLFPGEVMTATITAAVHVSQGLDERALLKTLQLVRLPKQMPSLDGLLREVVALAQGERSQSRSEIRYSDYFLVNIGLPQAPDSLDRLISSAEAEAVALLIGASNTSLLRNDLIARVTDASAELNVKAVGERLLLNRQGILYLHSVGKYQGPHPNRFSRTRELAKLALYARELLRDDQQFSMRHRTLAHFVVRRVEQWIEYPELVFDASVSETRTWEALTDQLLLVQRLAAWNHLFEANADRSSRDIGLSEPPWWTSNQLDNLLAAEAEEGKAVESDAQS